jgi:hypothetical protein
MRKDRSEAISRIAPVMIYLPGYDYRFETAFATGNHAFFLLSGANPSQLPLKNAAIDVHTSRFKRESSDLF